MHPVSPYNHRRFIRRLAIAGLVVLTFAAGVPASERPMAYEVKAAFLERFGKFVEWPETAFADSQVPLVIGIVGSDPFHGVLEDLAANERINGHRVEIRHLDDVAGLKSCHILYIPAGEKNRERELLDAVAGAGVLTVSDIDDFCASGGMIQFVLENDRVHFEVNNDVARAAGLKISSKLLTLAKSVKR